MRTIDLQGHVALVTGASLGLGAAIAQTLAEAGAAVVVNYAKSASAAVAVVAGIEAAGGRAMAHQADVRSDQAVEAMFARAGRELGAIDIVVNNAGREEVVASPFELSRDDYQEMLDLNLHAMVGTCRAALPAMQAQHWGRVINIASMAVFRPVHGFSAYASAKAAMVGLTRNLAHELGPHGVTVNAVSPGWIPVARHADQAEAIAQTVGATPLGYAGSPRHVADAVLFFASPLADFVTGANLQVAGGHNL